MFSRVYVSFAIALPLLIAACSDSGDGPNDQGKGGTQNDAGAPNDASGGTGSTASGGKTGKGGASHTPDQGEAGEQGLGGSAGAPQEPSEGGAPPQEPAEGGSAGQPQPPGQGGSAGSGTGGSAGNPPVGSASRFFLTTPSSTNTVAPKVVLDSRGGLHVAYPAYVGGKAFYAYCASNCTGMNSFKVVELAVGESIANVALATTPDGKPRLVLSEFDKAYYASCDSQCTTRAGWTLTPVYEHDNDMEVTGQALALDSKGRPSFLMHTYVSFLGWQQKTPQTLLGSCESSCNDADSWSFTKIADDIFQYPEAKFDSKDRLQVLAAQLVFTDGVPNDKYATYARCDAECDDASAWLSYPLGTLYEDTIVKPSLSLALTTNGDARLAAIVEDADETTPDGRLLAYAECTGECASIDDWTPVLISQNRAIKNGVGLALDAGRPRVAFTLDYNIGVYHCSENCTNNDWQLAEVEFARNLPADDTFLFPGCSAGAWFLDSPSIAMSSDGSLRVGYRAYDVSGTTQPPIDPTKPRCKTGLDFTWSRFAAVPALK